MSEPSRASETSTTPAVVARWGRRGLALVLLGLLLQLLATFYWSPGTFILSAAIGVPLVLLGAGLFGWAVLRGRRGEGRR
jgi:hypothetical protein